MSDTFTITTTKDFSYADVWEAIWGSDGSGITYWCDKIRKPNGEGIDLWLSNPNGFPIPNPQDFKVHDYEEGKWHTITLTDLAEAVRHADREHLTHCGSYAITDLENADECVGDVLIQLAIWKEIVYG